MSIPEVSPKPSNRRRQFPIRLIFGSARYGPAFMAQVGVFYLALVVGQVIATGRTGSRDQMVLGLVIVTIAVGLSEATFRLYRRVWEVAGLSDAIALALAVIEATSLVTLADALFPPGFRPYPIAIPVLVAPIVLSTIGAFRLLPRLLLRRSIAENRLLVVVQDLSLIHI